MSNLSILSICQTIAAKIKAVYAKGKTDGEKAEKDAFWYAYQHSKDGKLRTSYQYGFAFQGWNDSTFYPEYIIKPTGAYNAINMFHYNDVTNIRERLGELLDLSEATVVDNLFNSAKTVETPTLNLMRATTAKYLFIGCSNLTTAPLKNISLVTNWLGAFDKCYKLTDIGQDSNDFGYFSASVDLSQTDIDFCTQKMSFYNLLTSSGGWGGSPHLWLKADPNLDCTLTISQKQLDDANNYLHEYFSPNATFNNVVNNAIRGWKLSVVKGG